ncbi:MAG: hypothetical protein AB7S38_14850 [Vulcanimicrobiota bacterium]
MKPRTEITLNHTLFSPGHRRLAAPDWRARIRHQFAALPPFRGRRWKDQVSSRHPDPGIEGPRGLLRRPTNEFELQLTCEFDHAPYSTNIVRSVGSRSGYNRALVPAKSANLIWVLMRFLGKPAETRSSRRARDMASKPVIDCSKTPNYIGGRCGAWCWMPHRSQ